MINLDMVGRLKPDSILVVNGTGTSPAWEPALKKVNKHFSLTLKASGIGPSDHTSFYLNDIPALHFFTGQHEDYHRPADDVDKLNYEGMDRISEYVLHLIVALDSEKKLTFIKTKNESESTPRFKVTLGVVPDYRYSGTGMRIDGVSEDRPAQKAGLQKGDVVLQLGEYPVSDMMSYMQALSKFEKGQTTTVTIDRNGEKREIAITF